ncbi:MAG: glutaredoxin family protein [Candidatus Micrarchaeia archaeon]|jgi:alkyl hydroperoxide reductase subunit F
MPAVTVFSAPDCGVCSIAKEFLKRHNVEFEERNVREDPKAVEEVIELTGQRRIPVIVAGDYVMVGFNAEQLKRMLALQFQESVQQPSSEKAVVAAAPASHSTQ